MPGLNRHDAATARRAALPLALSLAVHLLLVFGWTRTGPPGRARAPDDARQVISVLLQLPERVADQARKPLRARPAPAPKAAPRAAAAPAVTGSTAAPSMPPAPPPGEAPATVPSPAGGAIMAGALRDIGKIDRELRDSQPPAPHGRPDTPLARFEGTMASAFVDRSNTLTMDRYTYSDGVIIDRIGQRGKTRCFRSGTVNFVPGILRDSSRATEVACPPPGTGWTRM